MRSIQNRGYASLVPFDLVDGLSDCLLDLEGPSVGRRGANEMGDRACSVLKSNFGSYPAASKLGQEKR